MNTLSKKLICQSLFWMIYGCDDQNAQRPARTEPTRKTESRLARRAGSCRKAPSRPKPAGGLSSHHLFVLLIRMPKLGIGLIRMGWSPNIRHCLEILPNSALGRSAISTSERTLELFACAG